MLRPCDGELEKGNILLLACAHFIKERLAPNSPGNRNHALIFELLADLLDVESELGFENCIGAAGQQVGLVAKVRLGLHEVDVQEEELHLMINRLANQLLEQVAIVT